MSRRRFQALLVACLLATLPTFAGTSDDFLQRLQAKDVLGAERLGRLWSWNRSSGRVELYDSAGEVNATVRIDRAKSLDVDSEWGVAALARGGSELRTVGWDGQPLASFPLPEPMGDVVWIDAHQVAVSPTRTGHRVEIWNTRAGALVRAFGQEQPIQRRPGARFARSIDLAFDHRSDLLWTVESRTGELQAFSLEGVPLCDATVRNPRHKEFQDWLASTDEAMKEKGESHLQGLWYFRVSTAPDGSAWLVKSCQDAGSAEVARIDREGVVETMRVDTTCCSTRSTILGDRLILYRPPALPGGSCMESLDLPRRGEHP